jgi:signal transduction histidine kinase
MKLGQRLALGALVAAVPLFLGTEWLRRDLARRAEIDGLAQLALTHMQAGGREACEADPRSFGGPLDVASPLAEAARPAGRRRPIAGPPGPGPGPRERARPGLVLWAYDGNFDSTNPRAPRLLPELREALDSGDDVASHRLGPELDDGLLVAIRTPWSDGPCAFVTLTRRPPPEGVTRVTLPEHALGGPLPQLLAVVLVVGLATWLAAGPLVRRLRRLTAAVESSARSGYSEPVAVNGNDELAELARAFNAAGGEIRDRIETIEGSAAALRAFLSNTTHDVMQPLTVLQGHLGTIRRRLEKGESPDRGLVAACQEEAHYVASLVHNLTAAARLESGAVPVQRDPVDLRGIVERAVARHRPMADSRGLSLELAVPEHELEIDGDVTLLEQAIGNLVHNAVRHNTTGEHVAVVLERAGEAFVLRVLDDGPGVDEARLARLAERRFRTDEARQRDPSGQGLGLAIAREVAERHGFELTFARPAEGGFEATLRGGPIAPANS